MRNTTCRKRDDLGILHNTNDALKGDAARISGDLAEERRLNDGCRVDLDRTNAAIDSGNHALHEKRGRIDALHAQLSHSKIQEDLNHLLYLRDRDLKAKADSIADRDITLRALADKYADLDKQNHYLREKIGHEDHEAFSAQKEATNLAVRNRDLDSRISCLKANVDDRHREIALLNGTIKDLNAMYASRRVQNTHLEADINGLSQKVDTLSIHNRGIGHELNHAADRKAVIYGDYYRADYLHHKQRDYEDIARSSAVHVDHVRSNSPARSPIRKYY